MHIVAVDVRLQGFGLVLGVALACYLVGGQPFVGALNARRFRAAADPHARLARYYRTITLEWALCGLALLVVLVSPRLGLADLGVQGMRWSAYSVVGLVGLLLSVIGLLFLRFRMLGGQPQVTGPGAVLELLPRTPTERRVFAALAVSAGICEELLYRGFALAVLAAIAPSIGPLWTVVIGAVAFGLAHAYQRLAGMLVTGVLGGCLAVLYLGTGSLLLPVAFHALVDLRVLVLPIDRMEEDACPS
jgi:membrane protease YdiL (CAAX protease family)